MVFLQKCDSYEREKILSCMQAIFAAHGGIARFARPGLRVVIKPNLIGRKKPEEAATTHPSLVWACAKLCREAGAQVTVADSPGGLYERGLLRAVYRVSGMEEAAADAGAALNFDTSVTHVQNPEALYLKSLDVLTPLAQADVVINIAKLKTHGMMAYTGAVKNLFGSIAGVEKAEYHCKMPSYDAFADTLIDIFQAVRPALHILDGVIGMHRDGPTAGDPIHTGFLLSSEDAFALDLTALAAVRADPARVPLIRAAWRRGLLATEIDAIPLSGAALADITCDGFVMKYNDDCARLHFRDGFVGDLLLSILKPRPVFLKTCRACGECARSCPVHAITVEKGKRASVELERCIRCFCCQELCPFHAVKIKKSWIAKAVMR